ncbi:ATP-binding protein [Microbacter margulisiae]|uniref:MinD superfamily P-loop ATPase n=1 Tax=Microbacter margulisiae TaxID=1350067 RepID=A0A7W5DQN2_9PORP|nr:ATP-binding protein [Microbacter margulisiae]MBB3186508.1 MinD superfamily P-loop ATPase [Microbacter margulisiae]
MKEIVVISGKGGTGKTSITASFAMLAGNDAIVADCDVDAADMHMLLSPEIKHKEPFYSGQLAVIDADSCIQCGKCADICRFNAIPYQEGIYKINAIACEGCGYCARICPTSAIHMEERKAGRWFISNTKANNTMIHADLDIGAENSGKLVAKVKNEAKKIAFKQNAPYVIVDGSPGIGCPVQSSLTGASYVVLVTEPTVSGLHDLERVVEVVKRFKLKSGCIINKSDLNHAIYQQIIDFLVHKDIQLLTSIPFDPIFTNMMIKGKTVVENGDYAVAEKIEEAWNKIKIFNQI